MKGFIDRQDKSSEPNFLQRVSLGKVPGVTYVRKFSYIPNLQATTGERGIWEFGSTTFGNVNYNYPPDYTAPINTISSSSTLDVGKILVIGLDILGNEVAQYPILNGQNKVTLAVPLWRCFRMANVTANNLAVRGSGYVGQVYVYEDTPIVAGVPTDKTKVRAFLNDGNNSTLMSMYTIPKGKVGIIVSSDVRLVQKGTGTAILRMYSRQYNGNFRVLDIGALSASGTSVATIANPIPSTLPEKSDILLTADVDTNGMGLSAVMYILLYDKLIWDIQ